MSKFFNDMPDTSPTTPDTAQIDVAKSELNKIRQDVLNQAYVEASVFMRAMELVDTIIGKL